MLIKEFCDKHHACTSVRSWALSTRLTKMSELISHPDLSHAHFRWIISRDGVLSHKDAVMLACFCARQNWKKLTDERSRKAVEVAEAWARGEASVAEASAASASAYASAAYAAYAAATYAEQRKFVSDYLTLNF